MATTSAIKRQRPEAVTSVELIWTVPPALRPLPARPGVLASGTTTSAVPVRPLAPLPAKQPMPAMPPMHELTAIAVSIAAETTFDGAALRLQREVSRLTGATEALCVAFDWPRRLARTVTGIIGSEHVTELVAQVAGSGRRALLGNALLVPIGPAPARAVLALRRATAFQPLEAELVAGLAHGVSATFERLLR
ncbi:MAG: hypothetical protein JWP01_396 [Myxococcales bacterium]|nr:hypothetical protein [Myxococcales bacterium]